MDVHKFLPFKRHRGRNVDDKLIMLSGRGGYSICLDINPVTMLCTEFREPKKPTVRHICELLTGRGEDIRQDIRLYLEALKGDGHLQ
jgi:hypothetical protein